MAQYRATTYNQKPDRYSYDPYEAGGMYPGPNDTKSPNEYPSDPGAGTPQSGPAAQPAPTTPTAGPETRASREQIRDAWMSRQGHQSADDLKNFVNQYSYYNPQMLSNDKVRWDFGNGKVEDLDMIIDQEGKGQAGWGADAGMKGADPNLKPSSGVGGPGGSGTPSGPGSGGGGGGYGGGPGYDPGMRQALIDALMKRANQSLAVTTNDPTMRAQIEPFQAAQERNARNQIADAAEAGGPVQNLEGSKRLANEQAAINTGGFASSLIGKEIDSRRQEIQAALSGMQGYITDEDRMALERELGYLQDATQRYGIDTGAATSRYNTDVGASTSRYNTDVGAATTRRGQDMSNDQYYSDLGLRADDRSAYWDAVRRGLL